MDRLVQIGGRSSRYGATCNENGREKGLEGGERRRGTYTLDCVWPKMDGSQWGFINHEPSIADLVEQGFRHAHGAVEKKIVEPSVM